MSIKIDQKIKSYSVAKPGDTPADAAPAPIVPIVEAPSHDIMHEGIERPEALVGNTFKIKTPTVEHAMYVTINDIILNAGTEHEQRRPYEIFINSKNMDQFQWVVALTRVMSAVFRKGGDVIFLVKELRAVFDPQGGYYKKGGVFMPSLIAEIGAVLEKHLMEIGMMEAPELSAGQRQLIAQKRAAVEAKEKPAATPVGTSVTTLSPVAPAAEADGAFPASATLCKACHTKALVVLDGCETCLNCGASKCG